MKVFLKYKLLIIIIMVSLLQGCNKDYLDINKNPNAAISATPELVLPSALAATAARLNPISFPNTAFSGWMGQWAISGSYAISSADFTTYKETTAFGDGTWQGAYHNLNDLYYVETQSKAQGKFFYTAAAKVMKAFNFQILVDLFNNVPYSQAFQGTKIIHPAYDDGKTIYLDLIKQLDTAITYMKRSDAIGDPKSDILFSGDNGKWIRFSNTLKLRILMRQSKFAPAYVQTEIGKILAEGSGFLGAGEDANVNPGYFNSSGEANPFWGGNINVSGTYINDFWRANQFSITFFKNENDPRLKLVYGGTPSDPTKYQGNFLGQISGLVGSNSSVFGPGVLKSFSQDATIMTAAESFFLQAEAALYGWIPGGAAAAQDFYQKGVTESFRYFGVPNYANAAVTYYTQANDKNVNWIATTSAAEQLALIIRQKWAAMNTVTPLEAYDDYRRLGLPADIPLTISPYVDVLKIPYRFLYVVSEYRTNADAVTAQGNIDHHTSKIFWMP